MLVETELNRIWSQSEKTRYIIAKCGDINLTDEDIISLKGNNWLTDQVNICPSTFKYGLLI